MDAKELEAQLEQIDKSAKSDPVDARIEGDAESGRLIVSVNERVDSLETARDSSVSGESGSTQPVTLLDVDLSSVNVSDDYINEILHAAAARDKRDGVVVELIGGQDWELMQDWTHKFDGYSITVKKGSVYNRASIPRVIWPIIGKDDLRNAPPLIHDLLYEYRGDLHRQPENPKMFGEVTPYRTFKRKDVDNLFLALMREYGVSKWRYVLAYQAVKNFAYPAWSH